MSNIFKFFFKNNSKYKRKVNIISKDDSLNISSLSFFKFYNQTIKTKMS